MEFRLRGSFTDSGDDAVVTMSDTNAAVDTFVRVYPVLHILEVYRVSRTVYLALMAP